MNRNVQIASHVYYLWNFYALSSASNRQQRGRKAEDEEEEEAVSWQPPISFRRNDKLRHRRRDRCQPTIAAILPDDVSFDFFLASAENEAGRERSVKA